MNLLNTQQLIDFCKKNNIKPNDKMGQNFLICPDVLKTMISRSDLGVTDTILEVGPGLGVLTRELAKMAKKVIVVELDRKLVGILREMFKDFKNVEIVHGDILKSYKLKAISYKLISNLPYSITSRFLKNVMTSHNKPTFMALLLQKEVGERICTKAGDMSLLSISVQLYCQPKIVDIVKKQCFWPEPKVDSAIVIFKNFLSQDELKKKMGGISEKDFFRTCKIGFSAKRKTLLNNFSNGFHISKEDAKKMLIKANIDLRVRAQELGIGEWIELANGVVKK